MYRYLMLLFSNSEYQVGLLGLLPTSDWSLQPADWCHVCNPWCTSSNRV